MQRSQIAALFASALLACPTALRAQAEWPNGPIRIVTPTPVGVGSDTFTRIYADQLGKELKTTVIVENRAGASGTLGTDAVAKSAPNGFTLLVSNSLPFTTAPFLLAKVPYNPQKDFIPVAQLYGGGSFLIAGPAFKGASLKELIATAKQKPNSINFASYGPGSTAHLGMELLQEAAGIQLVQIPYKQSALPDLIGGQVDLGWEPPASALANIRAGKVKALAYSGHHRSAALPDVPTLAELLSGLELNSWVGVWAPAGTPDAVIKRLRVALATIGKHPDLVKALTDAAAETMDTTPAQMAATIEREAASMSRLIKAKGISVN